MAEIKKIVLKSGRSRYRAVVDVGRNENGGRKQQTITRDTKTEVKEEIARILHQRAAGTFVVPNKLTVAEVLDMWVAKKARDLEPSTIRGYRNALVHVHEYLGRLRVQQLTEDEVESMVAWLLVAARRRGGKAGSGLRPSTASGVLARLKESLGWAVVRKLVHANVAEYVQIPRKAWKEDRRTNRRPKPWNVVEVKEFLMGIRGDRLFAVLLLSLMGLRPAEVAGLRWTDIDLDAGALSIDNTRTMIGNAEVLEKDTKTEAGERVLPLPEPVRQALIAYKALQEIEQMSLGSYYAPSGYMFVDHLGQPLTTRHLREHAYSLMLRLKMRQVRLYDARHSCLTFLAVNGVSDVILAAWAGHVSANFTKRVYVHPGPEDLRAASDHLAVLLGVSEEAA
ncbi:site-specific integrase [Streptomyces sp. NBC_01456]|uniref:tyrosine-type recombinase/integrase n=1 Tax=unclassified Streptomyces TaxID=2593676 RepID=UPI002E30F678|nr:MULTISPECIES: tyrosine-type recombinase/integrase [unclassified Streptomyces]